MKLEKMSDNLSELLERVSKREDSINANMNEKVFIIISFIRALNIKEEMRSIRK